MTIRATVRFWRDAQGWGVVDAPEVPGGCYVTFTAVDMAGYRSLTPGSPVELDALS